MLKTYLRFLAHVWLTFNAYKGVLLSLYFYPFQIFYRFFGRLQGAADIFGVRDQKIKTHFFSRATIQTHLILFEYNFLAI